MNLIILLSSIVGAVLFFLFKRKWLITSILFGLCLLFFGMFLFGKTLSYEVSIDEQSEIYLLIDSSKSARIILDQSGNSEILQGIQEEIDKDKIFYFADNFSHNTNQINEQYSAIYDTIYSINREMNEHSRLLVISDFNDNYSLLTPVMSDNIYPVLLDSEVDDRVSIYQLNVDEYLQTGDKSQISVNIQSETEQTAYLELSTEQIDIYQGDVQLSPGTNLFSFKQSFYQEGYSLIKAEIFEKGDVYTNNNTTARLVKVIPSYYKILVIAGKPSQELAFLRRFLNDIKWIETEFTILKTDTNTINPDELYTYSGLILLDIHNKQVENPSQLSTYQGGLLYLPGLNSPEKVLPLIRLFTNLNDDPGEGEIKFEYNDHELFVDTQFKNSDMLIIPSSGTAIFLGWNTWKWDFMNLAVGIDMNYYNEFWKNQLIFLISSDKTAKIQDNLNYVQGEDLPIQTDSTGMVDFYTNGQTASFYVGENPSETGILTSNYKVAKRYSTNISYLSEMENIPEWLNSIRGSQVYQTVKTITIDFKHNIWLFITFLIFLILFWLSADWADIKS